MRTIFFASMAPRQYLQFEAIYSANIFILKLRSLLYCAAMYLCTLLEKFTQWIIDNRHCICMHKVQEAKCHNTLEWLLLVHIFFTNILSVIGDSWEHLKRSKDVIVRVRFCAKRQQIVEQGKCHGSPLDFHLRKFYQSN